jgi:hypothetical protein
LEVKNLRYLPLTFLCGMPGFVYFAPVLIVCTAAFLATRHKPLEA